MVSSAGPFISALLLPPANKHITFTCTRLYMHPAQNLSYHRPPAPPNVWQLTMPH